MKDFEYEFYEKVKNWDFSMFNTEEEKLTKWDMYEILRKNTNEKSKILDLGTGGGENLLENFPDVLEILETDYSKEMIETAKQNLLKSRRKNINFRVMDSFNMDTKDDYYDVVVARNTVTVPKQIYKTLKKDGLLIIRGVDKLDCWDLKKLFGKGQGYHDSKPISQIDYEAIIDAGFKDVELVPLYVREYFKTKEDLIGLLLKTTILDNFSEENLTFERTRLDLEKLNEYIESNTKEKGIVLKRNYYGITARK